MHELRQIRVLSPSLIGWLHAHGVEPVRAAYVERLHGGARGGARTLNLAFYYEGSSHFWSVRDRWRKPENRKPRAFLEQFAAGVTRFRRVGSAMPREVGAEIRFDDGGAA